MFKLLDIAPIPVPSGCGRKVIQEVPHTYRRFQLDTIGKPIRQVSDSISNGVDNVTDSLSSVNVVTGGGMTDQFPTSMLVWAILAVVAALIICFCFVFRYRQHKLA